jgi:hypothetical protein
VTTTTIESTAAPLQFTAWERPGRDWEEPGLRSAPLPPSPRPGRTAMSRLWRFLTEPRDGIRHEDFFAPYGRPRSAAPRPWC